jgi:hypothetical protein
MKRARLALLSIAICAAILALSGCGSSVMSTSYTQSSPPPTVSSVGLQTDGVAANRWLYVQFSEDMDPSTINSKTITVADSSGTAVPGNVAYFANFKVAGFQPNPALQENASYTFTITTGAASDQGVHLAAAYTQQFTTRASMDTSPISVEKVTPSSNATCVSATTPITITFNELADVSTITSANIVITGPDNTPIPAKIGYNVANSTVTLTPNAALPTGTITVTVSNVADAAGVPMIAPFTWSFSTDCNGGGGGGATTQYTAPLFGGTPPTMNGQVTIDTAGSTTIQLNGAGKSTTYTVQFCPAVDKPIGSFTDPDCFDVTTLSTDSGGNASSTVMFPKTGSWAGDFQVNDSSGSTIYMTYLSDTDTSQTYMAVLLPETMVNGGIATPRTPPAPLTSGIASFANGALTVTVKGALLDTEYGVTESGTRFIYTSSSYFLDSFTTDASGNGTLSTALDGIGGDMFTVRTTEDLGYVGYISGFIIPQ